MPTLNFDGHAYDLDLLTPEAREIVDRIQLADQEIRRLQQLQALLQSARPIQIELLRSALRQCAATSVTIRH